MDPIKAADELDHVISAEPTPEFAATMTEIVSRLLARLYDPALVQVAVGKLEGMENAELAQNLACSQRTVERKLQVIRRIWDESP